MSAMKHAIAEAAELLDMAAAELSEALAAADRLQAVQDLTAEWSQGSADPSQAMLAVHRVVHS